MKTPEQIAANARERARRQNEKAKENWDLISCRLPKGTKNRMKNLGLTVNGAINTAVLAYLDDLEDREKELMQAQQKTVQEPEKKASAYRDMPEDLQAANEWLHQIQEQNAKKNNGNPIAWDYLDSEEEGEE